MSEDKTLRIIVLREGDTFIAQCLEYDIGTQAEDMASLQDHMNFLIDCELEYSKRVGQPIDQAPERFHNMWDEAVIQEDGGHEYRLLAAA